MKKLSMMYDGDTFERNGLTFRFRTEYDNSTTAPWKNEDGHGPVSDWRDKDTKRSGELVLNESFERRRFYDFREAVAIAKRDGWGIDDKDREALAKRLGRDLKPGDVAAEAARKDFERLRGWCNNEWHYCGVIVTLLDVDGHDTPETESLWGIEDDADDYLSEVAHELADEIFERVKGKPTLTYTQVYTIHN